MMLEVPAGVQKLGAGVLLVCRPSSSAPGGTGAKVLLLNRNSKNNPDTWGLPGGNADPTDKSLYEVACREALEEMGTMPDLMGEPLDEIETRRGKHDQKAYTVFICEVTEETMASYVPKLNEEHSDWRWFEWGEVVARTDLHPVVDMLANQFQDRVTRGLASAQ